jgi:hypothetical protein
MGVGLRVNQERVRGGDVGVEDDGVGLGLDAESELWFVCSDAAGLLAREDVFVVDLDGWGLEAAVALGGLLEEGG